MNNSNLEFRKIKSLNFLYEINENGTIIRNVKSKKQLSIHLDYHHSSAGYYKVSIHLGGRKNSVSKHVTVHSLVAECWLGDKPEGYEIDHIDRNSHNNNYKNLRYVTKSEQMKNRDHTNISKRGSLNLEIARDKRAIHVIASNSTENFNFSSLNECARELSKLTGKKSDSIRDRLKRKRSHIHGYDIKYILNAETGHGSSTEQGTVH